MYDYHTHSFFSDDCGFPIRNMIEAAIAKGVEELAVTDHFDPDYPDPEYPFTINFPLYHKTLLKIEGQYAGRIKIVKGLEIGIQHGATLQKCRDAASSFGYDFLLGSFHCTDRKDLYSGYFAEGVDIEKAFHRYYEYAYSCLKEYMDFDVMGHINVVDRYVPFEKIPAYGQYMDKIEAILRLLAENGKGIEFNASCYRYLKEGRTTPTPEILKLYRNVGGEIITFGSDAHNPAHIGSNYKEAIELLKTIGFRYLAAYRDREVRFIKI